MTSSGEPSEAQSIDLRGDDPWQLFLEREKNDAHVRSYAQVSIDVWPEIVATYDRLLEVENRLFPGGDYEVGSARIDDDRLVLHGLSRVLITAEHASIQIRKGKPKEADMGTGALAEIIAQDTNSTAIIATGRQTGDPNYEPDHTFKSGSPDKDGMAQILALPNINTHFAYHMLDRGQASCPTDSRGYSILLGIGDEPSEATIALKDSLLGICSDLDLRGSFNVHHITFDKEHQLKFDEDGCLHTVCFKAAGPNTTRTFSQSEAERLGKNDAFAAIQIEFNEVLLVKQNDEPEFPSLLDRQLGSHRGYLFAKLAVEAVAKL